MRITGGSARGIVLRAPAGEATRPATDRAREAVFSSLGDRVPGARVADLFAGAGTYGLEAMSRGAASGFFAETNPKALQCLRANREAVARACGARVDDWLARKENVFRIARAAQPYDLVFLDPPYAWGAEACANLLAGPVDALSGPETRVLFEAPGELDLSAARGWVELKRLGKKGRAKPGVAIMARDER